MAGLTPGDIHVDSDFHYLYLIQEGDRAIRYGVAVGAAGREFSGEAIIQRKAKWPRWTPTQNMIERDPEMYGKWAGGMPGGPQNPLGARALYLYQNGQDTLYRIHGTPQPWTIGRSVSSGCVRMINEHVADLYERVPIGTKVVVY
jgi:lipoprotein-anchoring transpeptidase ErfK/SrfK